MVDVHGTSSPSLAVPEEEKRIPDITIATIGNVDSGKSTLVGVLTKSILDDGRGLARSKVFNFGHEQENGRTSSIAHEIMGFHTLLEKEQLPAGGPGQAQQPRSSNTTKKESSSSVQQMMKTTGNNSSSSTTSPGGDEDQSTAASSSRSNQPESCAGGGGSSSSSSAGPTTGNSSTGTTSATSSSSSAGASNKPDHQDDFQSCGEDENSNENNEKLKDHPGSSKKLSPANNMNNGKAFSPAARSDKDSGGGTTTTAKSGSSSSAPSAATTPPTTTNAANKSPPASSVSTATASTAAASNSPNSTAKKLFQVVTVDSEHHGKRGEKQQDHQHNHDENYSAANNYVATTERKSHVVPRGSASHPIKTGAQKNALWQKIQEQSDRLIQFVDLCGHEKYLKTTIFGLVGLCPDYAIVVVNANAGLQRMTREHIGIAIALRIPIIIVVTKKDMTPGNVYDANMLNICKVLKSNAVRKLPVLIKHETDVEHAASSILSERIVPVFSVSSVTGDGLDFLRSFLYNLQPRAKELLCKSPEDKQVEFHIESIFLVAGVGVVVAGFMRSGTVTVGSHLYLGPDSLGKYKHLIVRGIHIRRVPKSKALSGDHCSFSLRAIDAKEKFKKSHFRKGMVLLSQINTEPVAFREFEAEIVILHHSTTIRQRYQAVIHCGVIRQSAEVLGMSSELLRTGDKATVRFRFLYHVEFMRVGWTLLFREGRTKGIGRVTKVLIGGNNTVSGPTAPRSPTTHGSASSAGASTVAVGSNLPPPAGGTSSSTTAGAVGGGSEPASSSTRVDNPASTSTSSDAGAASASAPTSATGSSTFAERKSNRTSAAAQQEKKAGSKATTRNTVGGGGAAGESTHSSPNEAKAPENG
ncbi:unnamed protein product [Amoebophrya sp. A120]|nr:unnamed protein product [Amoebophrya sp. A120]|eukprot:GSA120T00019550001.1